MDIRRSEDGAIHKNKWFHLILGLVVTVVCLWVAVKDVNWQEISEHFTQARYDTIPVYLICLVSFYALKAHRWALLLRPVKKLTSWAVTGPMMVGFMGNNLLPAHLGEFFRVFLLAKREQIGAGAVFSSVAIERLFDVIAVLLLVGIGLITVEELPPIVEQGFMVAGIGALVGVIVLGLAVAFLDRSIKLAIAILSRLPISAGLQEKLTGLIHSAGEGARVLSHGPLVIGLLANSVVQWGLNCAMIAISFWSFGIEVPFTATLILLGVLVFAVTIPSSPGFIGAIQAGFVVTLKMFGIDEASALAASIYYHVIQYVVVTGVGMLFLGKMGLSLSSLQAEAEHVEEELEDAGAGQK